MASLKISYYIVLTLLPVMMFDDKISM